MGIYLLKKFLSTIIRFLIKQRKIDKTVLILQLLTYVMIIGLAYYDYVEIFIKYKTGG
jgi:hypothetical protein